MDKIRFKKRYKHDESAWRGANVEPTGYIWRVYVNGVLDKKFRIENPIHFDGAICDRYYVIIELNAEHMVSLPFDTLIQAKRTLLMLKYSETDIHGYARIIQQHGQNTV